MAKKAITFLSGWSRYNPGDTAAFDEAQADDLIEARIAKLAKRQPKSSPAGIVTLDINFRDMDAYKEAIAEIERNAADLVARSEQLDQREAELNAREAEPEAATVVDADGVVEDAAPPPAKASLPKQGR